MKEIVIVVAEPSRVVLNDYKSTRNSGAYTFFDVENTQYNRSFPCQRNKIHKTSQFSINVLDIPDHGRVVHDICSVIPQPIDNYYDSLFFDLKVLKEIREKQPLDRNPPRRMCLDRKECFTLHALFSLSDRSFASKEQLLPLLKKAIDEYGYLFITDDRSFYRSEFTLPLISGEEVKIEGYSLL